MPVRLARVRVGLPACDSVRGAPLDPTRTWCYVDTNGSGGIWVTASAWPRLMASDDACRAVLEAASNVEAGELHIIGKAVRVELNTPAPTGKGQLASLSELGPGAQLWLSVEAKAPHPSRHRPPPPTLAVGLDLVLDLLQQLGTIAPERRAARLAAASAAGDVLRNQVRDLFTRGSRVRPDVDNVLAYRVAELFGDRPGDDRRRSWSAEFLAGRKP